MIITTKLVTKTLNFTSEFILKRFFEKEAPYVMKKKTKDYLIFSENEKYEGFCIDLLEKISKMLEFNYGNNLIIRIHSFIFYFFYSEFILK